MNRKQILKLLYWYLKHKIKIILLLTIYIVLFITVFNLYSIEINREPVYYAFTLSASMTLMLGAYDFIKFYKKHNELDSLQNCIHTHIERLPDWNNQIERDYQSLLHTLFNAKKELALKSDLRETDMIDYYTLWAHQVKTPIAAMRLLLQSESGELNSDLIMQLKTIEQYVEMVLGYLRIESQSSDLNFKKHDLSKLVKQAIRNYSHFFIKKNISLDFEESEWLILTDEKWLTFVIEQIIFNALKYTQEGKISISFDDHKRLIIKDTGIGIAEEDLPRIFEKGFTGYNGRMDKKATGIGLYLSKKILNKLSHSIQVESKVGEGTTVILNLSSEEKLMD